MTSSREERLKQLKDQIRNYPDFPKPGILFRDIFAVLQQPDAFQNLRDLLVEHAKENFPDVDVVVGLESRGFLFGTLIALELGKPFVPIRKKGKLPGEVKQVTYSLEYGTDCVEAQAESISEGQQVLVVDDLLATGGTAAAACELVESMGGKVAECLVIMELEDLNGRQHVPVPVHSLVQFS